MVFVEVEAVGENDIVVLSAAYAHETFLPNIPPLTYLKPFLIKLKNPIFPKFHADNIANIPINIFHLPILDNNPYFLRVGIRHESNLGQMMHIDFHFEEVGTVAGYIPIF